MTFQLIYSDEALSQLKKLENVAVARIFEKLDSTLEDPTRFF